MNGTKTIGGRFSSTRRSRFSRRDSPALRRTWGNRTCRFFVNIRRSSGHFYAIEPQLSAKKYPLKRALLVTCRQMEVDDIISYHDVVTQEKIALQKG
jgi:hypothetical protein